LLAIALFIVCIAMVFELLWLALAGLILIFASCCWWIWPKESEVRI